MISPEIRPQTKAQVSILLVDDEAEILTTIQEILLLHGTFTEQEIFLAKDGAEALEIFKERRPDIAVTDLNMPRLNGFGLIDGIRELGSSAEIVVMTGYADLESTVTLFKRNVSDFVQKPFDFTVIAGILAKIRERVLMRRQNDFLKTRLAEAEKLSSIGLLAAGVAHEVNNPNTFIKGNAEMIKRYADPYLALAPQDLDAVQTLEALKEIAVSAEAILRGSDRINKIASSLLHYTRSSNGAKEPVSIADALAEAQALSRYRLKKHQFRLKLPPQPHPVLANFIEISQVLLNLIVNAIDAVEDRFKDGSGGLLAIEVRDEPETRTQLIQLSDNGSGIPTELATKVFDPFFTTKPVGKGSGLGLSICRGIVESHDGSIQFTSGRNEGTTFRIRLPWTKD